MTFDEALKSQAIRLDRLFGRPNQRQPRASLQVEAGSFLRDGISIALSFSEKMAISRSFNPKKERHMNQTYHFKVLYEKLHNGSYRAWVPVLPACQASGSSMDQVRMRIEEAIHCYCLNMLENGAVLPSTSPGLPTVVDEVQISVCAA
jgi:predicted RNase H-like HicB family nuclease